MTLTAPQKAYLDWLKAYDPALYEVLKAQATIATTLGATEPTQQQSSNNWFTKLADNFANGINKITGMVEQALPTYQAYKTSQSEIKLQTERMKQELLPQPTAVPTNNPPATNSNEQSRLQEIASIAYNTVPGWQKSLTVAIPLGLLAFGIYSVSTKK